MELEYFGANCVTVHTKKARLVIDDNLLDMGLKPITNSGDIVLFSTAHGQPTVDTKLIIDTPGEYEVSDVSIQGVAARAYNDESGKKSSVIYKIVAGDIRLVVAGNIYPELNDGQLETLGTVDVLVLPIGGNNYTLDGSEALRVIKKIEPKIIVPTHYADKQIKYPLDQQNLDEAVRGLALEAKPPLDSLKLKYADLSDITQLIILKRQ